MALLRTCFLLALGIFVKVVLYRIVMGEPCTVRINANPFVKKVEVLHSTPVACFIGASDLEEKLGDFTDEIELANTNYVKEQCALLAQAKAYKLFALGMDGLCLSAADMENKYYVRGTNRANCKEGFGKEDSMFVYSLEPLPFLQPLGCFTDKRERALPEKYADFCKQFDDEKREVTIYQCAWIAHHKGYKYFAVQFYGQCWAGNAAGNHYDKYGKSSNCLEISKIAGFGIGKAWANFVYQIIE